HYHFVGRRWKDKAQVGPYDAECFRDIVLAGAVGDDLHGAGPVALWYLPDDGNGCIGLYVFFTSDLCIHLLEKIDGSRGKNEPQYKGHRHNAQLVGGHRFFASFSIVDDPDVGGGKGKVERILLSFLQQVEIQLFFYLLLTGDGLETPFLFGQL